jgi:signal transduction histidine kinase
MQAYVNGVPQPCAAARKPLSRLFFSLSARLLITCIVALALSLGTVAAAIVYLMEHYPAGVLGRHPETSRATKLAAIVRLDAAGRPAGVTLPPDAQLVVDAFAADVGYRIVDAQGRVVQTYASPLVPFGRPGEAGAPALGQQAVQVGGKLFHVGTARIPNRGHPHAGEYFAQVSLSERFDALSTHYQLASVPAVVRITFVLAVLMFGLTLRLTLRSMLKPLVDASNAAAQISPGTLSARLPLDHVPTELRPLIDAFNAALVRLDEGYKAQQMFLASAAHELQTPLTLIRGQIEMQDGIVHKARLLQDVDLMARQVRQLLHLTELSEQQNYSFATIDLVSVMNDVVQYLERKVHAKRLTLAVNVPAGTLMMRADKSALFILLKNLLENALSVAPMDSIVTLSATAGLIRVEDEGPGIDPAWLPFIFERFWRAPGASYEGAGLGLAICKEIAAAHGWSVSLKRLPRGTSFQISFAGAAPAPAQTPKALAA